MQDGMVEGESYWWMSVWSPEYLQDTLAPGCAARCNVPVSGLFCMCFGFAGDGREGARWVFPVSLFKVTGRWQHIVACNMKLVLSASMPHSSLQESFLLSTPITFTHPALLERLPLHILLSALSAAPAPQWQYVSAEIELPWDLIDGQKPHQLGKQTALKTSELQLAREERLVDTLQVVSCLRWSTWSASLKMTSYQRPRLLNGFSVIVGMVSSPM